MSEEKQDICQICNKPRYNAFTWNTASNTDMTKVCLGIHMHEYVMGYVPPPTHYAPTVTAMVATLIDSDLDKIRAIIREEVGKAQYAGIKHNESLKRLLHTGLALGGSREDIFMIFLQLCNMFDIDIDTNELARLTKEKEQEE